MYENAVAVEEALLERTNTAGGLSLCLFILTCQFENRQELCTAWRKHQQYALEMTVITTVF